MKRRTFHLGLLAALPAPWLSACGGGGDSSTAASVRLVNATRAYGTLDLYSSTTRLVAGVAEDAASTATSLAAGSHTFQLRLADASTVLTSQSISLSESSAYTVVAFNTGVKLSTATLTDSQSAPTSGTAAIRVFNGASSVGAVDVYLTDTDTDLASVVPVMGTGSAPSVSSYVEVAKGSYRLRVTASGDRSDVRLDLPAVALADQQITTLLLTGSGGGVLVHGQLIDQQGALQRQLNTQVRARVVAGVTGNGTVDVRTSAGVIGAALQSPSVGNYVLLPASLDGLTVQVNGVAVDTSAISAAAGDDITLLVSGDAAAPALALLKDDNAPAASTSNTKLRLVHAVNGLGSTLTLSVDYLAVASNLAYGEASTPAEFNAGNSLRLETTTPVRANALYLADGVTLTAQKVYTLFMLGDATAPIALLRKDR